MPFEGNLVDRAEIERIERLSPEELDRLPFGAIRLDAQGNILAYNRAESALSGRVKESVLGKSFFTEVAPCTNVQSFGGKFREGVAAKRLHTVFPFIFDHEMDPRNVWVTLFYSLETDTAWVFVREDRRLALPD